MYSFSAFYNVEVRICSDTMDEPNIWYFGHEEPVKFVMVCFLSIAEHYYACRAIPNPATGYQVHQTQLVHTAYSWKPRRMISLRSVCFRLDCRTLWRIIPRTMQHKPTPRRSTNTTSTSQTKSTDPSFNPRRQTVLGSIFLPPTRFPKLWDHYNSIMERQRPLRKH